MPHQNYEDPESALLEKPGYSIQDQSCSRYSGDHNSLTADHDIPTKYHNFTADLACF